MTKQYNTTQVLIEESISQSASKDCQITLKSSTERRTLPARAYFKRLLMCVCVCVSVCVCAYVCVCMRVRV